MRYPYRSDQVPGLIDSIRSIIEAVRAGQVTLRASETTTTVVGAAVHGIGPSFRVVLFPVTANAATELGNGTIYVSEVTTNEFTVTHADAATEDRTFNWIAVQR